MQLQTRSTRFFSRFSLKICLPLRHITLRQPSTRLYQLNHIDDLLTRHDWRTEAD
jgi:hypothetical protein